MYEKRILYVAFIAQVFKTIYGKLSENDLKQGRGNKEIGQTDILIGLKMLIRNRNSQTRN